MSGVDRTKNSLRRGDKNFDQESQATSSVENERVQPQVKVPNGDYICLAPLSLPIMSLGDLIKHIPAQKERIDSISAGLDSETEACAYWSEFRKSIWGREASEWQKVEDVDRGDDRVRDDHIPDGPPGPCSVVTLPKSLPDTWSIDKSKMKILVRADYHEALNAAVLANNAHVTVFVVSGQPGIGELPFPSTTYPI